jgi:hypothetical protein
MANPTVDKILRFFKLKEQVWYRRSLAAADPKLGWGEIPDCPMDFFEQLMEWRAQHAPDKDVPGIEQRMLWFKHSGAFRNSAAMKQIFRAHGAVGATAAYRLLEIMCERYGEDGDFSGSLVLAPPFSESWLRDELFGEYHPYENTKPPELLPVLRVFEEARLIELEYDTNALKRGPDGIEWVPDPDGKFLRITIPNFRTQADDYTVRRARKGLVTPV